VSFIAQHHRIAAEASYLSAKKRSTLSHYKKTISYGKHQLVKVKVLELDDKGRMRLSMKALIPQPEAVVEAAPEAKPE